jgi:trehalose synthase-fused probable maltokinase
VPAADPHPSELPVVELTGPVEDFFETSTAADLEREALGPFLSRQRWFGSKARTIESVHFVARVRLPIDARPTFLCIVQVRFTTGDPEEYLLPLAIATGKDESERLIEVSRGDIVARISGGDALVYETGGDTETAAALLSAIQQRAVFEGQGGQISGVVVDPGLLVEIDPALRIQRGRADQSNTSFVYGNRLLLKLLRRLEPGPNPEFEIGSRLTKQGFEAVPRVAGGLAFDRPERGRTAVGILQQLVPNRGSAWEFCLSELVDYLAAPDDEGRETTSRAAARQLGVRTGELHVALASITDEAFAPEPLDEQTLAALLADMRERAAAVLALLAERADGLPPHSARHATTVLARGEAMLERFGLEPNREPFGQLIRVHGDYHLGQVLRREDADDFVILDFEGEPARPLAERRARQSALKDLAGMLRSFAYAGQFALMQATEGEAGRLEALEPVVGRWIDHMSADFLEGYRAGAGQAAFLPARTDTFDWLLGLSMLDKAFYELAYELNSRPDWTHIPLTYLAEC